MDEMKKSGLQQLDDSEVAEISGGFLFDTKNMGTDYDGYRRYEVLDDNGDVVRGFRDWIDACDFAEEHGYSDRWLTWEQVQKLRSTGSPD